MVLGFHVLGVVVQLVGVLSIAMFSSFGMLSVALLPLVALSFLELLVALVLARESINRGAVVLCLRMSSGHSCSVRLVLGVL